MYANRVPALFVIIIISCASAHAATIETVPVGNPGNPADTRYRDSGFGSVGKNFRIGKYEVTNSQYVEFLNGVDPTGINTLALYSSSMSSQTPGGINFNADAADGSKYEIKPGRGNNPVIFVSWYDAIRFTNWLHNGRGNGDTENGAYRLTGGTPTPSNGMSITRNPGARWWLPSEDEWHKAAYHKNDGATGHYWDYPTSTNATPFSDQPPGSDAPDQLNTANFYKDDGVVNDYDDGFAATGTTFLGGANSLTDVGAYPLSKSAYGTFDQGGNVWEWNEAVTGSSSRGIRGGSWVGGNDQRLHASFRGAFGAALQLHEVGFRVASIPEPAGVTLSSAAVIILGLKRARKQHPLGSKSAMRNTVTLLRKLLRFGDPVPAKNAS